MQLSTWLRPLAFATQSFARRAGRPSPRSRPPRRPLLSLETLENRLVPSTASDVLYVGDNAANGHSAGNSVQGFDAGTGAGLGTFVSGSNSLKGVRGLIFDGAGHLLLANQDVGTGKSGQIMSYDATTGAFEGDLVSPKDPHAPFAPRGIVLKDKVLYVANLQDTDTTKAGIAPDGEIDRYNATTGQFLGAFSRPAGWVGQFNPRGVVFGPDGNLYVSVFDSSNMAAGSVLKVNVTSGAETLFASTSGGAPDLHRPEGLTFGPDGRLYATGFRADATDTDKIVVLDPTTGAEVSSIALDAVGQPRAYGQALLFGPGGRLFVPISTLSGPFSGSVRSYDVGNGTFVNFEAPGTLGSGWYLTFRNTDPATLAYLGSAPAAASSQGVLPAAPGTPTAGAHAQAVVTASVAPAGATVSATVVTADPASPPATQATPTWLEAIWAEEDLSGTAPADPLVQALTL
jgi:hypothetical protein